MVQHDKDRRPGRSDKETIDMLLQQNDTLRQAVLTLEDAKARAEKTMKETYRDDYDHLQEPSRCRSRI